MSLRMTSPRHTKKALVPDSPGTPEVQEQRLEQRMQRSEEQQAPRQGERHWRAQKVDELLGRLTSTRKELDAMLDSFAAISTRRETDMMLRDLNLHLALMRAKILSGALNGPYFPSRSLLETPPQPASSTQQP